MIKFDSSVLAADFWRSGERPGEVELRGALEAR